MLGEEYRQKNQKRIYMMLVSLLLMVLMGYCFTTLGMSVSFDQAFTALFAWAAGTLDEGPQAGLNKIIVLLRLPRILLAIIAGCGLALSGAIMQSITRNYLVSPFTLGVSSAAAFGASICIVFGTGGFFQSNVGIVCCAFVAACSCGIIVYGIAQQVGIRPTVLVLVGIALNYFFSALTAVLEFFADENKLAAVVQWTFGSFNRANWDNIVVASIIVAGGLFWIMFFCLQLNAIAANDDEAVCSLGIDPARLRIMSGLVAVLMTATIISFTGVIGFVGLIAPHMARLLIGSDHQFYLPFSCIVGAALLLLADTAGRLILYPVSIPVGIIISFLGVPLFVHLILRKGKDIE